MASKIPTITSPPWSVSTKRVIALVLLVLGMLLLMQISQATWTMIVITLVLAYLFSPLVAFFERRLAWIGGYDLRRTISVLLSWLMVAGTLGILMGLVIPATIAQVREFAEDLPDMVESTQNDLKATLSKPIHIGDFTIVPWMELEQMFSPQPTGESGETDNELTTRVQDYLLSFTDSAIDVVGGAVSVIVSLFLMIIMMFYLMRDGPTFANQLAMSVPESYRGDVLRLMHELALIWNAYLRGQLLLCAAVGTATYIAALILGLPQPLLLGLIAGFLELIPNLGPTLATIPAVLFALTTPSATFESLDAGIGYALVVALVYNGIQQLEAIFLVPRIMGSSLDLHPFAVLLAIVIMSSLAGLLGIILAAPAAATLRLFGRYIRGKLLDEEAFPVVPVYLVQRRGIVYRLMRFFLNKKFPVMTPEEVTAWTTVPREPQPSELSD